MSYASDHLAWQQRVNKEVGSANQFSATYVPLNIETDSPLKGIAEKYSSPYCFADPNAIGKYDLKDTINKMEVMQKNKAKRLESYRKSCSNLPAFTQASSTYQSTTHAFHSPQGFRKTSVSSGLQSSPRQNDLKLMLAKANSSDVFTNERFPRPKPFFEQAYLAKSKVETPSQAGPKLRKAGSMSKLTKAHYPPGHANFQTSAKLPNIKSKRFNEDALSEYSVFSKIKKPEGRNGQNAGKNSIQQFVPTHLGLVQSKPKKIDGSHLSQVSDRAEELKRMLIDTIEHMDDKEVEVMKSAIQSVKNSTRNKVWRLQSCTLQ